MKRNMYQWVAELIAGNKRPLPLLSSPCVQPMGICVRELVSSAQLQAEGMELVAKQLPAAAAVSVMDLSVEAQAFGAQIRVSEDEIPTVVGALVSEPEEADNLEVPPVGAGRTGLCVQAIALAAERITDRPVLAGVIGPFSLAGRLMDVSEAMIYCYDEPEMVHTVLEKCTEFLIAYCRAFQQAGANGVVMAEPLAGLLSPAMAQEFSHTYVRQIVEAVQTPEFIVIYHNCGNNVAKMAKDIYTIGATGYHFGDAVAMEKMLPDAPEGVLVMGNVSPSAAFLGGTPESVREQTRSILSRCGEHPGFVLSSGCDIPPMAPWDNIRAFFAAAEEFEKEASL